MRDGDFARDHEGIDDVMRCDTVIIMFPESNLR